MSTYASLAAFVDTLATAGVGHVCVAPGSRSAPLALLFAAHPDIRLWSHLDERSAGFFALGAAKAKKAPVALLCTSGTAAANFYPSIVEAAFGRVPLIVLTADRPHEARSNASPQAIDQIKMYGDHVKWFVDMPLPNDHPTAIDHARQAAMRAVATALQGPPGPVHLNFPFQEPLIPAALGAQRTADTFPQVPNPRPDSPQWMTGPMQPAADDLAHLAHMLRRSERGIIVCGPQENPAFPPAVTLLGRALGFPLLADPLSGLRTGHHDQTLVIDTYDALLRHEDFSKTHRPDIVVRFGGIPASKPLLDLLYAFDGPHVLIDPFDWRDPFLKASHVLQADPVASCRSLADRIGGEAPRHREPWSQSWRSAQATARRAIESELDIPSPLFEGRVFPELARLLPPQSTLVIGNSMPIRDLDSFFPTGEKPLRLIGNRGANGIDGLISTALGIRAATDDPVVLVIGDLSFYHDINGLFAAKKYGVDMTVVLINNDGGGIFSFLPQARLEKHFEPLFGTPHGLDFAPFVTGFGGRFTRVRDWDHFSAAVASGIAEGGLHVVEVQTDRVDNVTLHEHVWRAVRRSVAVDEATARTADDTKV